MDLIIDISEQIPGVQEEDVSELRRALLWSEREKTRQRGQRKLRKIVDRRHPYLSPIAQGGLASSYYWSGDFREALYWAGVTAHTYPMTAAAVWCSSLTILVFRTLGMRRERFEAEGERFRLMQKIAFQGRNASDRAYALQELVKEYEARDLPDDARKWADELRDLIAQERFIPFPLSAEIAE